ncbi:hypothetical protein E2704_13775 [Salmonella enterica]|nr:hypothetical protein DOE56_22220 [Salmonella enterica subsp. arizonae serovar 63:g,z51:-]EAA9689679.1 hypothetical protein [Salmonella enterica]EAN8392335.1 hypothetical protein [Salmonella enterica subsp. arizonae serovar 13,23:gz51:-]EAN8612439.1 hypothetical protein [Salmonella enterica subsp. arizonae serovar 48:z4,z24:-]EAO5938515.1 hypothetical protein [Salmonella enterica subsp. houtenae serovar 48:g,z51:-]EAT8891507.1 hypothetical protein [Salmonella enterica subsp. arizonae serovar
MASRRAFLRKKKADQRSAKVHVGFSYFGFERCPLNGRCLQGLNEKPLRFFDVLLIRKVDRDNRSLLCYLSP